MVTTIAYIVVFSAFSLFDKPTNKIQLCDVVLMVAMIVVTSVRYDVGADWQQYYRGYSYILASDDYINQVYSWYGLDSGFWYLMAIVAKTPFGGDPYAIFWVVSAIAYPAMVVYFRKGTVSAPWALLAYLFLGFFGSSINVLRHTLSSVCILWCFEAHIRKKHVAFFVLAILAIVFHASSIFAIVAMVVSKRVRPSGRLYAVCLVLGMIVLILFTDVFRTVSGVFPFLSRFQTTVDAMSGALDRQYMWIVSLIYFVLATGVVFYYLRITAGENHRDPKMDSIVSAICVAMIPNVASFAVWPADRMAFFIFLLLVALIPYIIKRNPKLQAPMLAAMCLWHVPYALFAWDNVNALTTYLF